MRYEIEAETGGSYRSWVWDGGRTLCEEAREAWRLLKTSGLTPHDQRPVSWATLTRARRVIDSVDFP